MAEYLTLTDCVRIAKFYTAQAKAVKAYRLRAASRKIQALDIPKGYFFATVSEVNSMLRSCGIEEWRLYKESENRKRLWCLVAGLIDRRGKIDINIACIC